MTTQPISIPAERSRNRLLSRLRAIRRTGTAVTLLAGGSQAVLAALVVALAAIGLDYLLRMPGLLRLVLGIVVVGLAAAALQRFMIRRLRLPSLAQVARQVQRSVDGARDGLGSGAEFAVSGCGGPMVEQTVALAADLSEQLAVTKLVRWRWVLGWLASALLALSVLAAGWGGIGWWVERGLQRLAWPVVRAEWPRRVQIVSSHSGQEMQVVAAEPVTLQARIARGPKHTPAVLVLAESDHVRRFEMTDIGEGIRTFAIRPLASGTFWFEAGDGSTEGQAGRIRVVHRPQAVRAEIVVQPPVYTGQPASRFALGSSPVRVPEGSRVDMTLSISKDIGDDAGQPRATIVLVPVDARDAQPAESLDVHFGTNRRQITAGWRCDHDCLIRATFIDTDRLANAPLQPWRIVVQKDQVPTIESQAPADGEEATPTAVLAVRGQAGDDWGVRDVHLGWQVGRAGATQPAESLRVPTTQPERIGGVVRVCVDWDWSLALLSLQPGDRVIWHLAAQDNFDLDSRTHEPVRSPARTIRIIGSVELLKSVLGQLALLRQQIAQLHAQEKDLSQALQSPESAHQPAERFGRQADRQARIAGQTRGVAESLAAIAQRLEANRVERPDLAAAIGSAARELKQVQAGPMTRAQHDLQDAQAKGASDPARELEVADARKSADAAARALEDLLHRTGAWTTLESAALGLQDLIDRQQTLRQQTQQAGAETLGKPLEELSGSQRQNLQGLAESQRSLGEQLQRLWEDMNRHAAASSRAPADPQADRLRQAAEHLEQQGTVSAMAGSADEISRNITSSAQQRQQEAQQSMEQALARLRGQGSGQQLQQVSGNSRNESSGLAQRLRELARRQRELKEQTGQVESRRGPTGQLDRPGQIRLSIASKRQADLGAQVEDVGKSMEEPESARPLERVSQEMGQIARQMQAGSTGQSVQDAQQQAAEELLAMAAQLEQQVWGQEQAAGDRSEQGGGGRDSVPPGASGQAKAGGSVRPGRQQDGQQGSQSGSSQGNPSRQAGSEGARDEFLPSNQEPVQAARLPDRLGQVEAWGFLPPDQRRVVLQGMQGQPPERYRQLTERYWRVLNESAGSGGTED